MSNNGIGSEGLAAVNRAVDELPQHSEVLIVVDQFEELFTLCGSGERAEFIDAMLALADRGCRSSVRYLSP